MAEIKHEVCEHRDSFGSTIILGPGPIGNEGPAVCMLCNTTAPFVSVVGREHAMTPTCWCQPKVDYEDPVSGDRVYVHAAAVS